MSETIIRREGALGWISLNRVAALHALTTQMCRDMIAALQGWRDDASVRAVLLDHALGTRGFCAGGDIRMLAESGKGDGRDAREFFYTEYQLNHLLFTYPKPIVALMNGVVMGGGVGVSAPASFRIATENTIYAMPETGIGLFPDVGGGWFLPRLPGAVGMWLALTGVRLRAADCLIAGIATHYIPTALVGVARVEIAGAAQMSEPGQALNRGLESLADIPGPPKHLSPENIARVNRLFALESVEAIVAALEADGSEWSLDQLATLRAKSPQTLKVAFRQLREGAAAKSFAEEMRREYRIAARVVMRHDFHEGVRALIEDKDNKPIWAPSHLEFVTSEMIDDIFAPLPQAEEWKPLKKAGEQP